MITGTPRAVRVSFDRPYEEWSTYFNPDGVSFTVLSRDRDPQGGAVQSTMWRARSGAFIFSAGTLDWGYALDPHRDLEHLVDARIQRMTRNLLDRYID